MLSIEAPYDEDLKSLAAFIAKPNKLDSWKQQGVITHIVPASYDRNKRKLPKYFILNLFNPFAKKEYGYIDPIIPYKGIRSDRNRPFDIKTSDATGLPLLGHPF